VEMDEGKQFRISAIHVLGLDSVAVNASLLTLGLETGAIFNTTKLDEFYEQHGFEVERFIDVKQKSVCIQISPRELSED